MLIVGFYITYALTNALRGDLVFPPDGRRYFATFLFVLVSWGTSVFVSAEYPVRRLTTSYFEIWTTLRTNVLALLIFAVLEFLFKYSNFSRLFIGLYMVDAALLMLGTRLAVRVVLSSVRMKGWDIKTRLIVGAGPKAMRYVDSVESRPNLGLRIVGYVNDGPDELPAPCLGSLNDLPRIMAESHVNGVVVTLPVTDPRTEYVIQQCELQGVLVELVLDDISSRINSGSLIHGMGISRLMLSPIPHTSFGLALKRMTDFILSLLFLLVSSPVMLGIAIAIKMDDGGSVLFTQTRAGLYGRPFRMHKFRSMSVDAEDKKAALLSQNEMTGPVFKMQNDPRITKVGRFLRKTSLDELPQLWDVFIGRMSLVGPRPPLPAEVEQYDAYHRRRLSVKPGITCIWQISGRNGIGFEKWVDLDLEYIDNWTYLMDWKILFMTVPAVLRRVGAS